MNSINNISITPIIIYYTCKNKSNDKFTTCRGIQSFKRLTCYDMIAILKWIKLETVCIEGLWFQAIRISVLLCYDCDNICDST